MVFPAEEMEGDAPIGGDVVVASRAGPPAVQGGPSPPPPSSSLSGAENFDAVDVDVRTTSLESLVFFYRVCLTRISVLLPSSLVCF